MKILVIGCHPDDEILGCGGVISRFTREGHSVFTMVVDKGRSDSIDQRFDTVPILEWNQLIEAKIQEVQPDMVFTHFIGDLNNDHQIIAEATQVACRPQSCVKEIFMYETPGSAGVSISPFRPDTYITLEQDDLKYKIKYMEKFYKQELRDYPHARSVEGIMLTAKVRGIEINSPLAEAFMTIRRKI